MSHLNVVRQMAQVVYFGTGTDARGTHDAAVHAGIRANFYIVGKLRPPNVRYFAVPGLALGRPGGRVAKSVGADDGIRVHHAPLAQYRIGINLRSGIQYTIRTNLSTSAHPNSGMELCGCVHLRGGMHPGSLRRCGGRLRVRKRRFCVQHAQSLCPSFVGVLHAQQGCAVLVVQR